MERSRLNVFVYGTLKRGERNHEHFCRGALRIREATVRANLYDLPFGFPALVVREEDVAAVGTADPLHDVAVQGRLGVTGRNQRSAVTDDPLVFGEILTFDDPEVRLPALDRLEGFDPDARSLYRRVLVPVVPTESGVGETAWVYTAEKPSGTHLPGGRWPA